MDKIHVQKIVKKVRLYIYFINKEITRNIYLFSCTLTRGIPNVFYMKFFKIDCFWFKDMSRNYRVLILEFSPYLENCVGGDVTSI